MENELKRYEDAFRKAVLRRDDGCVWCKLHYRDEEHVKIPAFDAYVFRGKRYAACEFHAAEFRNILNVPKRIEMQRILSRYLMSAPNPETRVI